MAFGSVVGAPEIRGFAQPVRLVDARAGAAGRSRYLERHLVGAVHVDLDTDLCGDRSEPRRGGRHPLPAPSVFADLVGRLGIEPRDSVAVYDDKGGAHAAARFWWMLRALGHEDVTLLDGGLDAAVEAGFETGQGDPRERRPVAYPAPAEWKLPIADLDSVRTLRLREDWLLLDVRAAVRYRGESEPFDPVAGHIPGAVNAPYESNLDEVGHFLDAAQLRHRYERLLAGRPADRVVVSCGSGVTACHTLVALERAGLTGAALYVGSFSEWCRSEEPCSKGDTP